MDEIKFHDSVADRFRGVAVDITRADKLNLGLAEQPIIEGVEVVGYVRDGVWDYRMIVWYEGRYLSSSYSPHNGWSDTSTEMDEVFVVFRPTKPHKITRYIWE